MWSSKPSLFIITLALAASTSAVATDGAGDLEKQINQEYRGKILTLRQFCTGDRLHFGLDGHIIGVARAISWTTDAQLEVERVKLRGDVVEVEGRRLRLFYDPESKQLRDVRSLSRDDEAAKRFRNLGKKELWRWFIESAEVRVDLDLPFVPLQKSDVVTAIDRVFASSSDEIVDSLPAFWKDFMLRKDVNFPPRAPAVDGSVYRVGGEVTSARTLTAPDPEYSEPAREAGYTGTLVFWVVVSPEGHVRDLSVATPLGLGLDEQAADALSGWKFDPAHKEGVPVAVQISVQIDFNLF